MQISELAKRVAKLAADNSPAILSGIAVTGTLATAYLTGKATIKATELVRYGEYGSIGNTKHRSLSSREKVELVWKLYIPPTLSVATTITAIILANRIGNRRAAAVAAAYAISEKAFTEYREKVVEKLGERKEQVVRDEIAQDRVKSNPINELILIGEGSVICYDAYTGRYFMSDMETLRRAANDINYDINHNYYASLSDFYNKIGLSPTSMSDDLGWNADNMLELDVSAVLTETNKPCLAIDFRVHPIHGFSRLQ